MVIASPRIAERRPAAGRRRRARSARACRASAARKPAAPVLDQEPRTKTIDDGGDDAPSATGRANDSTRSPSARLTPPRPAASSTALPLREQAGEQVGAADDRQARPAPIATIAASGGRRAGGRRARAGRRRAAPRSWSRSTGPQRVRPTKSAISEQRAPTIVAIAAGRDFGVEVDQVGDAGDGAAEGAGDRAARRSSRRAGAGWSCAALPSRRTVRATPSSSAARSGRC